MDHPNIETRPHPRGGVGLFAKGPIRKDEVIALFDGQDYTDWDENDFPPEINDYPIQYAEKCWRDSAGLARFTNHSCAPNCGITDLFAVTAMRDLEADEEITWDYDMSDDSEWAIDQCRCGAERCRGSVRGYRHLPEAFRQDYAGYISTWLLEKYPAS